MKHAWTDYSGLFRGAKQRSGVTVMVHPDNPGFPNEWLLRRFGYIGECWPGLKGHTLEPRKTHRFRYRVLIHLGDVDATRVKKLHEAWTEATRKDGGEDD